MAGKGRATSEAWAGVPRACLPSLAANLGCRSVLADAGRAEISANSAVMCASQSPALNTPTLPTPSPHCCFLLPNSHTNCCRASSPHTVSTPCPRPLRVSPPIDPTLPPTNFWHERRSNTRRGCHCLLSSCPSPPRAPVAIRLAVVEYHADIPLCSQSIS